MVDLLHIASEVLIVLGSLVLSFYSFKLFSRFFRGGIFGHSFLMFGFAALMLGLAHGVDVVGDWTGMESAELELLYLTTHVISLIVFCYGAYSLYNAWIKLGGK